MARRTFHARQGARCLAPLCWPGFRGAPPLAAPGVLVPRGALVSRAAGYGSTESMCQEALENWWSLDLLLWPGIGDGVGLTEQAWASPPCNLRSPVVHVRPSVGSGREGARAARPIALISLFDGLGTARLALQDRLEELGQP